MGHHQTREHRRGQHSHHQIGLVRGQFGNVPEDKWLGWLADTGFDGWEEASWELDLAAAAPIKGPKNMPPSAWPKPRATSWKSSRSPRICKARRLGDEPSAKTLQFLGGESVAAYAAWRAAGNNPPRTDPFYVPPDVAAIAQKQAKPR